MAPKIDEKVNPRSVSPTRVESKQQKQNTEKAVPQPAITDQLSKNAPSGSKTKVLPSPQPQSPGGISAADVAQACQKCAQQIGVPGCKVAFLSRDGKEIEQVAALLAETFVEREPMAHALAQQSPEEFAATMHAFSLGLTQEMAEAGLTPIAKTADGQVIGLLMISPFEPHPEASQEAPPPHLAPIFEVLGNLEGRFADERAKHIQGGRAPRIIDLAMAATHRDYQGKHIGELLVPVGIVKALHEGYDEVLAKATSNSQKILKRAGFKTLAEVNYKTFEYDGKKPFVSIQDPPSAMLMWTPISGVKVPKGKL